jgi:hypothetical protein
MNAKTLTNKQIDLWLSANRSDIVRIGDYTGSTNRIEFRCEHHQTPLTPWIVSYASLKTGTKCPECYPSHRKTINNEYIDNWLLQQNLEYKRISDFVNAKNKMVFECAKHGRFETTWDKFVHIRRCSKCYLDAKSTPRKVDNEFFDNFILTNSFDFTRLSDCIGADKKVLVRCNKDGYEWYTMYNILVISLKNGASGCPKCSGTNKKTNHDIDEYLVQDGRGYKRASEYEQMFKHIEVTCPIHGSWAVQPVNLMRGRGCPKCATNGFKKGQPAFLYYAKLGDVYKIGITKNKVAYRIKRQHQNARILATAYFRSGQDALNVEQLILDKYKLDLVDGRSYGVVEGWTETFAHDILNSDLNAITDEYWGFI